MADSVANIDLAVRKDGRVVAIALAPGRITRDLHCLHDENHAATTVPHRSENT